MRRTGFEPAKALSQRLSYFVLEAATFDHFATGAVLARYVISFAVI